MRSILLAVALSISVSTLHAQVIAEKTLSPYPSKNKGLVRLGVGINSVLPGAGSLNSVTGAADVTIIPGDGFMLRHYYTFFRYNENMELVWQKEIEPEYSFGSLPYSIAFGDATGCYYVDFKSKGGNEMVITRFDKSGNAESKKYKPLTDAGNRDNVAFYLNEQGVNIIMCEKKKYATSQYVLLTFSNKDLSAQEKNILLPTEEDNMSDWHIVKSIKDKVIMGRLSYDKSTTANVLGVYTVETAEVDVHGSISNYRKIIVDGKDGLRAPTIEISDDGKDLYLIGYATLGARSHTDAFYLMKYEYVTNRQVYHKTYKYSEIPYPVPVRPYDYLGYPNDYLIEGVYEFDDNNGEFNVSLFSPPTNVYINKTFCSVGLDKNGELTSVVENIFKADPMYFKRIISYKQFFMYTPFFQVPTSSKIIQKKRTSEVITPLEYINSKADPNNKTTSIYTTASTDTYNLLIYFNDKTREIKATKLKK